MRYAPVQIREVIDETVDRLGNAPYVFGNDLESSLFNTLVDIGGGMGGDVFYEANGTGDLNQLEAVSAVLAFGYQNSSRDIVCVPWITGPDMPKRASHSQVIHDLAAHLRVTLRELHGGPNFPYPDLIEGAAIRGAAGRYAIVGEHYKPLRGVHRLAIGELSLATRGIGYFVTHKGTLQASFPATR